MISTGLVIEKNRIAKSLSQKEFSEKIGISQSHLSSLESDGKKASPALLEKIINSLEMSDEDRKHIEYYEEFRKTPPVVRMDYFNLESENKKLKEQLEQFKELRELDELLRQRYLSQFKK